MLLSLTACNTDTQSLSESETQNQETDILSEPDENNAIHSEGLIYLSLPNSTYEAIESEWISRFPVVYDMLFDLYYGAMTTTSGQFTLSFTPEQFIIDALKEESDDFGKPIPDIFNPTVFALGYAFINNDLNLNLTYSNKNKQILEADYWYINDERLIVSVPQLFGKYLTGAVDYAEQISDVFGLTMPDLPSADFFDRVIEAAASVYFAGISQSQPYETTLQYNNAVVSVDKVDIEITDDTIYEMIIAILELIKQEQELIEFIEEFVRVMDPWTYYGSTYSWWWNEDDEPMVQEFFAVEGINELIQEIRETERIGTIIEMTVYIYGNFIIRRDMTIIYDGEKAGTFTLNIFEHEDMFVYEGWVYVYEWDENYYYFLLTGNNNNGIYTGTGVAEYAVTKWEQYDYPGFNGISWRQVYDYTETVDIVFDNVSFGEVQSGNIRISTNNEDNIALNIRFDGNEWIWAVTWRGIRVATVGFSWIDNFIPKPAPALNSGNSIDINVLEYDYDEADKLFEEVYGNFIEIFVENNILADGLWDILGFLLNTLAIDSYY
jgi:hypothetical protein